MLDKISFIYYYYCRVAFKVEHKDTINSIKQTAVYNGIVAQMENTYGFYGNIIDMFA